MELRGRWIPGTDAYRVDYEEIKRLEALDVNLVVKPPEEPEKPWFLTNDATGSFNVPTFKTFGEARVMAEAIVRTWPACRAVRIGRWKEVDGRNGHDYVETLKA